MLVDLLLVHHHSPDRPLCLFAPRQAKNIDRKENYRTHCKRGGVNHGRLFQSVAKEDRLYDAGFGVSVHRRVGEEPAFQ